MLAHVLANFVLPIWLIVEALWHEGGFLIKFPVATCVLAFLVIVGFTAICNGLKLPAGEVSTTAVNAIARAVSTIFAGDVQVPRCIVFMIAVPHSVLVWLVNSNPFSSAMVDLFHAMQRGLGWCFIPTLILAAVGMGWCIIQLLVFFGEMLGSVVRAAGTMGTTLVEFVTMPVTVYMPAVLVMVASVFHSYTLLKEFRANTAGNQINLLAAWANVVFDAVAILMIVPALMFNNSITPQVTEPTKKKKN